ncbi:MAG: hypothetical protein LBE55_01825 [Clostridiales bacterium]|jgi:hypothetical protein|nr:hypothetical protein [Clostridiales bacterium]
MTNIVIDGAALPAPDTFSLEYKPIGEFCRNANGNLVGELVAVKTSIAAGWRMLDDAGFKRILAHTKPFFASVEYYDPQRGARRQKLMHTMPKGGKVALDAAGRIWWKDVTCVFVER